MTFSVVSAAVVDVIPADVRVLDHLEAAIERPCRSPSRPRGRGTRPAPCSAPASPGTAPSAIRPDRANLTGCSAGDAVQPGGNSSVTDAVGRARRVVDDRHANLASGRHRPAPAAGAAAPRPPPRRAAGRAVRAPAACRPARSRRRRGRIGRRRNDRDLGRDPHRQRRHDEQLGPLLAAEDVAFVAVLHRQPLDDLFAARQRRASPGRRTASAASAGRTARRRRTYSGRPRPRGASTARSRARPPESSASARSARPGPSPTLGIGWRRRRVRAAAPVRARRRNPNPPPVNATIVHAGVAVEAARTSPA